MFNVNNTYIRISDCIINVPLNQERKKEDVYVFLVSPPSITFNANGGENFINNFNKK